MPSAALRFIIAFLWPTWGRYWHDKVKDGKPLFTPENAASYGEWLGRRYKDKALIWILGGDRGIDNDEHKASTSIGSWCSMMARRTSYGRAAANKQKYALLRVAKVFTY